MGNSLWPQAYTQFTRANNQLSKISNSHHFEAHHFATSNCEEVTHYTDFTKARESPSVPIYPFQYLWIALSPAFQGTGTVLMFPPV